MTVQLVVLDVAFVRKELPEARRRESRREADNDPDLWRFANAKVDIFYFDTWPEPGA